MDNDKSESETTSDQTDSTQEPTTENTNISTHAQDASPEPTPTSEAPVAQPSPTPEQKTEISQQSASPKKSKSMLKLLVLLIILVALVVGGIFAYKHNKTSTKSTVSTKNDIPLIKYGYYNNPLNVFFPAPTSLQGNLSVQYQIFEGLVSFQNGTQIKPNLATSWSNPNSNTWIFNIRPNVYYHNGDKVTAQDVVYSYQQIQQQGQQGYSTYATNTISSVKALNNSTVEITTKQPDAILLHRLSLLFIVDSKAPANTINTAPWELGTGAFTVKPGTTPTTNEIDLVAFNKWHGGHVYTRALDYIFYADASQAVKDLQAGKLQIVDGLSLSNVNSSIRKNYNVFTTPQTGTNIISIVTTNPKYPTSNLMIRQALKLAINNQELLTNSQGVGSLVSQVIPPSIPGYNPKIAPNVQNIDQAKALVKEAGYPNGVTINLGVGEPLLSVGQEIAKEVKPAGININIEEATDEGTYFNTVSNNGYPAFIDEIVTSIIDGSDMLSNFTPVENFGAYNSSDFNQHLATADSTLDPTQRLQALQAASLTISNDVAYIPLYQLSILNAADKGIVFPFNDYDTDLNAYFANVYRQ